MAIITEARMQQLRGKYNQLNKEAMLPGEIAICDDHNPVVRTNTGYKEILTKDNAEYFEEKVTEIDNAISSANKATENANKAINDMGTATTENTQKVDNAIAQLETDKEQKFEELDTNVANTVSNAVSDLNTAKEQAISDMEQATNDNTQRVDNALTQLETDTQQKFTELDTQVTNTVNGAVSDLNTAKEQAISDMETATTENTQRVDNALQQITTKIGIDDTTSSTMTTYSSDKIDKLFEGVSGKPYKIVTSLPETGDENTLYFVPSTSPESNNVYDEYMYIDGMWEYIGSKSLKIDLSDYYNKNEVDTLLEDISESRVDTIEEVEERTPISAKDKMKLIVGKIVKTFADIKNIAFSGSIADITDFDTVLSTSLLSTESGKRALDEAVGKILNDKIEAILTKQGSTDISAIGNGTVTGALSTLNSNLENKVNVNALVSWSFSGEGTMIDDLDNCRAGQIHLFGDSTLHKPTDYGLVITVGEMWKFQIAFGTDFTIYFRVNINWSDWSSWKQLHN